MTASSSVWSGYCGHNLVLYFAGSYSVPLTLKRAKPHFTSVYLLLHSYALHKKKLPFQAMKQNFSLLEHCSTAE